jgi:hypothetical protein
MILSRDDIERCAEDVLRDFAGDASANQRTDIEGFAWRHLGLYVAYTHLSDDGEILGLTAYADTAVELRRYLRRDVISVTRNMVLLDERLYPKFGAEYENRELRRFTLAHECAHQILHRTEPDAVKVSLRCVRSRRNYSMRDGKTEKDWLEWQADAMAAALLMPPEYVGMLVHKFAGERELVSYDGAFNIPDRLALTHISAELRVSKTAAAIRLKHLGYMKSLPRSAFSDPTIVNGGDDL